MTRLAGACTVLAVAAGIACGSVLSSNRTFPGKTNGPIVFQSFRDGNSQLYVITSSNQTAARLTTQRPTRKRGCYAVPSWSPDGKRIAFEYNPDPWGLNPRLSDVWVMNADGSGTPRNLTKRLKGFDGDPAWSNDGKRILFEHSATGLASDTDVWVMSASGRSPHDLTPRSKGFDGDPAWSPFGTRIAFTSGRDGNEEIYLMDPNGRHLLNITHNPAQDFDPNWSPSGQFVAFVSNRDHNDEIYETNDRFQLQRLTNNLALDAFPAWSPDGTQIAFVSDRFEAGNRDLYVMSSDGTGVRRLTQSPEWDVAPDWTSARPTVPALPSLPRLTPPASPPKNQALACRD